MKPPCRPDPSIHAHRAKLPPDIELHDKALGRIPPGGAASQAVETYTTSYSAHPPVFFVVFATLSLPVLLAFPTLCDRLDDLIVRLAATSESTARSSVLARILRYQNGLLSDANRAGFDVRVVFAHGYGVEGCCARCAVVLHVVADSRRNSQCYGNKRMTLRGIG